MVDNQLLREVSSSVRREMPSGLEQVFHSEGISHSSQFVKVSYLFRKDVVSDSMDASIVISMSQSPRFVYSEGYTVRD